MITNNDFLTLTIEAIEKANNMINDGVTGYVACNNDYINVRGEGINNTNFSVLTIHTALDANLYANKKDAEKYGIDPYLRDGNNNKIILCVKNIEDVLRKQIEIAKQFLEICNNKNA